MKAIKHILIVLIVLSFGVLNSIKSQACIQYNYADKLQYDIKKEITFDHALRFEISITNAGTVLIKQPIPNSYELNTIQFSITKLKLVIQKFNTSKGLFKSLLYLLNNVLRL